ncbi:MAG: fumarylacetoacetate hydrolase family protein [Nitrososphaerota archaeon]|nr:fumarylacetoacetate hydrolase family protein [Nitrososphaerota archaeon]MDG7039566.1 fumarylacetoacetate hydrolase family protein [Nitrososphaerota archaeon]MDG7044992.1 fumarylacetoacetate hydrolase family protein [Nitrososphaerota archaeon]MDG7047937.1 fumarylacetoacetate hydrolase family protein [Nitrososphaerota archaeon]
MRLVKFTMDGQAIWGVSYDESVIPVASDFNSLLNALPLKGKGVPLNSLNFLAPLPERPKVIGLGYNYKTHRKRNRKYNRMTIFLKPYSAIAGPFDDIPVPDFVKDVDFEGELGIVMGKKGKFIEPTDALNYIMGYCIVNDLSARELQFGDYQWTRGKGLDSFAPVGPWIVSVDEVGDASNLRLRTWVNGQLKQDSKTSEMILDVPTIVSEISYIMTLEPGDLIMTGTPAGSGYFSVPRSFMKDGDVVRVEIDELGYIENKIRTFNTKSKPLTC